MDLQESLVSWRQVIGMLRVEIRLWSSSWVVRRPLQLNWRMKGLPGGLRGAGERDGQGRGSFTGEERCGPEERGMGRKGRVDVERWVGRERDERAEQQKPRP